MAKTLNLPWLYSVADHEKTREWIRRIAEWRDYTLRNNAFIEDDRQFILHLGGYELVFHVASSFSAIEVYQEIFMDNAHGLASGFEGKGAHTIFDIGANQGFYTLRLKTVNSDCRVIAVEPNPFEFEVLKENMERNAIPNVHLEQVALSASQGVMTLEIIPQIGAVGGRRIRRPERPWVKDDFIRELEVPTTTLDALFEKYAVDAADIIKIDAEGMEYSILRNCSVFDRIRKLVIEYHSDEARDRLIALLNGNHFELALEDREPDTYYGDLYFVRRKRGL